MTMWTTKKDTIRSMPRKCRPRAVCRPPVLRLRAGAIEPRGRPPGGTPHPPVRASLRLGAYQLLYTRVPPHAAVSSTVDLVRAVAPGAVQHVLYRATTQGWYYLEVKVTSPGSAAIGTKPWSRKEGGNGNSPDTEIHSTGY